MTNLELSIIILNFNTKDLTTKCVASILKFTKNIDFEILLVDNGSTEKGLDDFKNLAKKHKQIKILALHQNLGFAKGNNLAMKKAQGRYVLLLNSDTFLTQTTFEPLIEWMEENLDAGLVTCELKNKDGSHQASGGFFPNLLNVMAWMFFLDDLPFLSDLIKSFHPKNIDRKNTQKDWITGAFFLIRSEVVKQIGYLNPDFFMYVEDMEYCFRAKKANWQIWSLPGHSIVHLGGSSSLKDYPIIMEFKNLLLFFKKYYPKWQLPLFRLLFKLGSLIRVPIFTILKGKEAGHVYTKTFQQI